MVVMRVVGVGVPYRSRGLTSEPEGGSFGVGGNVVVAVRLVVVGGGVDVEYRVEGVGVGYIEGVGEGSTVAVEGRDVGGGGRKQNRGVRKVGEAVYGRWWSVKETAFGACVDHCGIWWPVWRLTGCVKGGGVGAYLTDLGVRPNVVAGDAPVVSIGEGGRRRLHGNCGQRA